MSLTSREREGPEALRGCLRDLTSLLALPAIWSGMPSKDILRTFCDVIETALPLDLIFISGRAGVSETFQQVLRVRGESRDPGSPGAARLLDHCHVAQQAEKAAIVEDAELGTLRMLRLEMGFRGRGGFVCVGATASQFPNDSDRLVLRAGVNLLYAALDNARLLLERERAARAKDEFLAMLGHELRNPLSPIVTALQLVKMRSGTQFAREQEIIDRQLTHLIRLVDDLLDISRVTSGKVTLQTGTFPLSEAIAKAVETVGPLMQDRSHVLTVEIVPGDLMVEADLVRVSQVLQNLLINAAKYTDTGGRIAVRAGIEGEEARIRIVDNGVGIDAALLPRVFDIFTQGSMQIDRSRGGLGIGLALVKSLVELHGGRVAASSAGRGQGSEFSIWLPLARGSVKTVAKRRQVHEKLAESNAEGLSVLVVDDNQDAALSLVELLRVAGYSVAVSHDAEGALRAIDKQPPQIAILDIGLPEVDGYQLARKIRARLGSRAPRLIALTGYGQSTDRERAFKAGFDYHLVKPVDLDKLFECLGPGSTSH